MKPSKTALFKAAKSWDVKTLGALLASSPHLIDATDPRGGKAIHIACAVKPRTLEGGTFKAGGRLERQRRGSQADPEDEAAYRRRAGSGAGDHLGYQVEKDEDARRAARRGR